MDHYVKGHLTNGLLLPITANALQKCSNYALWMLLELAGFAAEAGQQTNSGESEVCHVAAASLMSRRDETWQNQPDTSEGTRRAAAGTFSTQREELSPSGQRTSSPQDGKWLGSVAHLLTNKCHICKAGRVVLAKGAHPHQINGADLMLGQAEARPDGRQHKMELFLITSMSLIITCWFRPHSQTNASRLVAIKGLSWVAINVFYTSQSGGFWDRPPSFTQ